MDKEQKSRLIVWCVAIFVIVVWWSITYSNSHKDTTIPIVPVVGASSVVSDTDKDSNGCYTPDTVRNHYGENACVDYNVGYTYQTRAGTKFLDQLVNYASGFVGYIPYGSSASSINLSSIEGKNIKVTGLIQKYGGYPEVVITELSQVGVYN